MVTDMGHNSWGCYRALSLECKHTVCCFWSFAETIDVVSLAEQVSSNQSE